MLMVFGRMTQSHLDPDSTDVTIADGVTMPKVSRLADSQLGGLDLTPTLSLL